KTPERDCLLAEAETRLKRITHLQQAAATIEGGGLPAGSVRLETVDEAPQGPSEAPAGAREETRTPSPPQRPPVATVWERLDLFPFVTPNPRLVTALQSFAKGAGLAVSIAGALVLLGWALDLSMLTSISSDFVSMKPNAALGFVLAGGTLHVLSTGVADRRLRCAALAAAFVVALIGLLTLSEYLYGWNLSIDRLVFSEATGALGTSAPARMAPTAAFCFFLLGVSLLVLDVRRCYPVAQLLTLLAALVSLTALIGYVYGVGSLYMGGSSTAMALHSSLCFLLLSSGILLTRQDHGLLAIVTSDA